MKCFIPLAAILAVAMAGVSQVSVRLPFLNPAGVTYVGGPAPVGLAAGPYAQPIPYGHPHAYSPYAQQISPFPQHVAPFPQQIAPFPQPVAHFAQPVASVHHVPAVADVPVTHVEATHGVVQKLVDVAHPAVSTRKFHVRRPAIQKQFYDIEERVVVRPAGSALVELEEPLSKEQRGPALISRALHPIHAVHPIHSVPAISGIQSISAIHAIPTIPSLPLAPSAPSAPSGPSDFVPSSPPPSQQPSQDSFDDQDSVSVENPEFRGAQNQQGEQEQQQQDQPQRQQQAQQQDQQQPQQQQQLPEQLISNFQNQISARQQSFTPQFRQFLSEREQYEASRFQFESLAPRQLIQQQFQPDQIPQQQEQRNQPASQTRQFQQQQQQGSQGQTEARLGSLQQEERRGSAADGRSVFPSLRNLDSASSQANQQRLINLLTARGGVAEVGFGRSGPASGVNVEAGGVRARVLSATPAPAYADPTGERVSTRRVVVSRPVETLQELDVVEPATKLERVAVNTPTIFKTARLGVARVPTSFPVIHKSYAPAAVPLYGKTLAHPGLTYY